MKKLLAAVLVLVMSFSMAGCKTDGEKPANPTDTAKTGGEINLLTWTGYVPDEVVARFEEETGIKVNYSAANDNESMYAKLQAAKGGEYDVIILSGYAIKNMIDDGNLIREFEKSKLPNFKNIDPAYQGQSHDPDDKYSFPYTSATAILVYNSEFVDFEITGYEDLWRPELVNSVVLLDGDRDIIGLTLQTLDYSVNSTDPDELAEAKDKLLSLKPNVIGLDANEPHNKLISGEATVGYMFGSQATEAISINPNIKYVYPKEGMGSYTDAVVMTKNAPNEENAYTFLNFLLDGENSAEISNLINYTNCNQAAREFLSEEYLNNETIMLPASELARTEAYLAIDEAQSIYSDIWVAFKNE